MRNLRVVVADDHRLILRAIRAALEHEGGIEIVGEARDGAELLPVVSQTQPDVVLLDLRMPAMDGLRALELIRDRYPRVTSIVLSGMVEPELIEAALARGAKAFVAKHIDPRDLASVIRQSVEGSVVQTHGLPSKPGDDSHRSGLTKREQEIVAALARGLSNKQIGRELYLTEQTIKFHLTNIYRKLGVANRTEATRYAYAEGLVENPLYDRTGDRISEFRR